MTFKRLPVLVLAAFTIRVILPMLDYRPMPEYAIAGPILQTSLDAPTILSDTHGYDFSRYMAEVTKRVRYNWFSLLPETARLGKQGRAVVVFTIARSGKVQDLRLAVSSGNQPLDRAATGAIENASPFDSLPSDFKGDRLVLQFAFLYNIKSGDK